MRGARRIAAAVVVAAIGTALAGCTENDAPERTPADTEVESVDVAELDQCQTPPKAFNFRCGEIEVPFERADASYGTTDIGFAYREPDDQSRPSLGPIFAVEGGPGYSSTASGNYFRRVFGSLLDRHELVTVDMRGTGKSGPPDCPDIQQGRGPEWIVLSDCARRLGKHFESYRTAAAADDIDSVREGLGFDHIALYGDSYGTYLAQSYAWRHGENLNALVLDSAYPVLGEDPFFPSAIRTAVRSLGEVCDREPECEGDAVARLERMVGELREDRISVGPLVEALWYSSFGPPDTYLRVDRAVRAYLDGNDEPYKRISHYLIRGSRDKRFYSFAAEMIFSCNDYPMIWDKAAPEPERRAQFERAIEEYDKEAFPPFTPREVALSSEVLYQYCLTFPPPTDIYEPPADPDVDKPTEAPVLVVSGEHDAATTPWENRQVADSFPNAELFVDRDAGHVDALYYYHGASAREIRAFLAEHIGGEPEAEWDHEK